MSGRLIDPDRIRSLIDDGFLERDERGRIRVTAMGAPLLDTVVADVAAEARSSIEQQRSSPPTSHGAGVTRPAPCGGNPAGACPGRRAPLR